ncbi:MAG: hypothetical protein NTW10_14775 [Bacteroidetes bacterium]|nr:hypothetical protein [Bacteroidota bacterium]
MKKISILLLMTAFLYPVTAIFAQCKLISGDVSVLKGQPVINLQYDYSKMAVGKFKNADDYVADRTADMNKKKPGDGDRWAEAWKNDRTSKFQPTFEKNLNEVVGKFNVSCKENASDAKYTLIIRTTFTEPGYNIGITRQNAWIKVEVDLIETANPGTVLASMIMKREDSVNMMGYDYDTGTRIQSAYDRAGDNLGDFLVKNVFKK